MNTSHRNHISLFLAAAGIAFGAAGMTSAPQADAAYTFGDGDYLTISTAGDVGDNTFGIATGSPLPSLSDLVFNGSVPIPAQRGQLILDDGANAVFDVISGLLSVGANKSSEILLRSGSSLTMSNHTRTGTGIIGGAIFIGSGADFRILGSAPGAGDVVFSQNTVNPGSGGAIGASGGNARVTISDVASITFKENTADSPNLTSGLGGAIYASGTSATVSLSATGAITFSDNLARANGGAIAAVSTSASGTGASVSLTGGSISFEGNASRTRAGDAQGVFVGSGGGGAIYIGSSGGNNFSRNVPTFLALSSTTGDIEFRENGASSGAAISISNFQDYSAYPNGGVYASLTSAGKIVFDKNVTGVTPYSYGAVDIRRVGAGPGANFLAEAVSNIEITNNTNRAIYIESAGNPTGVNNPVVLLHSTSGTIQIAGNSINALGTSTNAAGSGAGGAGISIISDRMNDTPSGNLAEATGAGVNAIVRLVTDNSTNGNITLSTNTSAGKTSSNAYNPGRGGGAGISAIAGNFVMDDPNAMFGDPSPYLPNAIWMPGAASVQINSAAGLNVSENTFTMAQGGGYNATRSSQYIGGGAIYVFSTQANTSTPNLFDLSSGGSFDLSGNKALGNANPNGGAIFAVALNNYVNDSLVFDDYRLYNVAVPARGSLHADGTLNIQNNEATGKGGAVYLRSAHGDTSLIVAPGAGGGTISGNKAATGTGASLDTGAVFHIEGGAATTNPDGTALPGGTANFALDARNIGSGNTFRIAENTVGSAGTNRQAIYLKSGIAATSSTAGTITISTPAGGTVAFEDTLTATLPATNTQGYSFVVNPQTGAYATATPGTFAQIDTYANVYSPGAARVEGGIHRLAQGARFQTYAATGGTAGGSYSLNAGATLAADGTGNTVASGTFNFSTTSALSFNIGTAADTWQIAAGNTAPLLTLTGNSINTASGNVLPGANNINISGAATVGTYYLLDASTIGTNTVATTGTLGSTNLTLNGNAVTLGSSSGVGREYASGYLKSNPADNNKLYVVIDSISGNTQMTWTGAGDGVWRSESNTTNHTSWTGNVVTDNGHIAATTSLNGDIVVFDASSPANKRSVDVDTAGVTVAAMTVTGNATYTFTGGKITGSDTSSTYHSSVTGTYTPLTTGDLSVSNGANAIFAAPVQFNNVSTEGTGTTVNFQRDTDVLGNFDVKSNATANVSATLNVAGTITVGAGDTVGVLRLGDGGKLGASDDKNVVLTSAASVLEFNRSTNYTYTGTASGAGSLRKDSNGTLTISANQTYTGPLSVAGGTLIINNVDLQSGGGNLAANATIAGQGRVSNSGTFDVLGTLAPGFGNSIGTLSFAATGGNVDIMAGAQYVLNLHGGGAATLITSGGDISIAPGANLTLASVGGIIQVGDEFVIAQATGTITGNFAQTNLTLGGYEFSVITRDDPSGNGEQQIVLTAAVGAVPSPIPEPSTYALGGGLGVLTYAIWHNYRRHAQRPENNRNTTKRT